MSRSTSLAGRALLAIFLMVGFYALALGMAGGLLYIPYAEAVYAGRLHFRLAAFCLIGAGLILFSIVPRRDPFQPPGPQLEASAQPKLFERIRGLSTTLGEATPAEIYLIPDLNAWVAQRGGVMGIGSRRIMGLGLPLMQLLTIPQFEAVLAHEFGHYHGGDTRLGPWIYTTRAAMGRTLQSLASNPNEGFSVMSLLQVPFRWYANLYMRITLAISRAQEFAADRLAARTFGGAALADGLRRIHSAAGASHYYFQNEVVPVVRRGYRPPLMSGFAAFLSNERTVKLMDDALVAAMTSPDRGAFDTHPPLADRIQALEELAPGAEEKEAASALTLLENVAGLETQLVESWRAPDAPALKPIAWSDTGTTVLLPTWTALKNQHAAALRSMTLGDLPPTAASIDEFARRLNVWQSGVPWEAVRGYATSLLGAALACSLHTHGWAVHSKPGAVWLTRDGHHVNPFSVVSQLVSGELSAEDWKTTMTELALDETMSLAVDPVNGGQDPAM